MIRAWPGRAAANRRIALTDGGPARLELIQGSEMGAVMSKMIC